MTDPIIRVSVRREYDLSVNDLFPDGIPDPPKSLAREWPEDWDDARRAAFYFNDQAERNPFAESSFTKDFETECARSNLYATVAHPPAEPDPGRLAAIAACPEPFWHETHRYCPMCPWTEADEVPTS